MCFLQLALLGQNLPSLLFIYWKQFDKIMHAVYIQWLIGYLLTVNEHECNYWNLPINLPLPIDNPLPNHLPVAVGLPPLLNSEKGGKKCVLHTPSSCFEVSQPLFSCNSAQAPSQWQCQCCGSGGSGSSNSRDAGRPQTRQQQMDSDQCTVWHLETKGCQVALKVLWKYHRVMGMSMFKKMCFATYIVVVFVWVGGAVAWC